MNKTDELRTTADKVKAILQNVPETRNSDMLLYYRLAELHGWENGTDILSSPFGAVICSLKELGLPGFETVRRTRQKVQADFPELAGNKAVTSGRAELEEVFREYAREVSA